MNKSNLRNHYKELRRALSPAETKKATKLLIQHLIQCLPPDSSYIHIFLPIQKLNEIDTFYIRKKIDVFFPDIHWVVSKSDFETGELHHYLWDTDTILAENKWGIPEPVSGQEIDVNLLDAVLIPLLAFDETGNRLGYGKGFYDRFLAKCKPSCLFIGLSLFPPHPVELQTDLWDVPVHLCVTPEKTYHF